MCKVKELLQAREEVKRLTEENQSLKEQIADLTEQEKALRELLAGQLLPPERPAWVTQDREQVADAHLEAASTHYAWMIAIAEGRMTPEEISVGGDYIHHDYWYRKHMEGAWYEAPKYTEERLG